MPRVPLATDKLLATQVLRGEVALGRPVEGEDYHGAAVIGVMRAVAGTDWFLTAQAGYGLASVLRALDNAGANRLAAESAYLLRAKLGSRYAEFSRQMDMFDYEAALKTLQRAGLLTH